MTSDPALTYRESAGQNAGPLRLVILLYEQLIKDLQRAAAAMQRNQVEVRTQEIDHALVVVGKLQSALDTERGGEVARNLNRFYDVLRGSLIKAEVGMSADLIRAQVEHLLDLREAWIAVEASSLGPDLASKPIAPASAAPADGADHSRRADWKV